MRIRSFLAAIALAAPAAAPHGHEAQPVQTTPPAEAPDSVPPSDSPTIEAREVSMPAPPRRKGRRMVTLTLLDGTKVNLPARGSGPPGRAAAPPG